MKTEVKQQSQFITWFIIVSPYCFVGIMAEIREVLEYQTKLNLDGLDIFTFIFIPYVPLFDNPYIDDLNIYLTWLSYKGYHT